MISKGKESVGLMKGNSRKNYHQGQFFTPENLAQDIHDWLLLDRFDRENILNVLDNTAGIGNLIKNLPCKQAYAIEIDPAACKSLEKLTKSQPLKAFQGSFVDYKVSGIHLSILNPPFNVTIEDPSIRDFGLGSSGKFGEQSVENSLYLALAHALHASDIVISIIPRGALSESNQQATRFLEVYGHRIQGIADLPKLCFKEEGTMINFQLAIFTMDKRRDDIIVGAWDDRSLWYDLQHQVRHHLEFAPHKLARVSKNEIPKRISQLPVQGEGKLRLTRKGRNLIIQPDSQGTYSSAMDVIAGPVTHEKGPWRYGSRSRCFALDLHAYFVQNDPLNALQAMIEDLKLAGLQPTVDAGFLNWFKKDIKRQRRDNTPFRRYAKITGNYHRKLWLKQQQCIAVTAREKVIGIEAGDQVELFQQDGQFSATGRSYGFTRISHDTILEKFEIAGIPSASNKPSWVKLYGGIEQHNPSLHQHYRNLIRQKGIGRWVYNFAETDLIEMASRSSGLYGAEKAAAKTRFSMALGQLIDARHTLIVLKAGHMPRWVEEYRSVGLNLNHINVIKSWNDTVHLKKFNLISYDLLKLPAAGLTRKNRNRYADILKGRVNVVICDEAHVLSNRDSLRSSGIETLKAKRLYFLTATAIRSWGRNIFNLTRLLGGDATRRQPFGVGTRPKMTPELLGSQFSAKQGTEAFMEDFVNCESYSNEMLRNLSTGWRQKEEHRINNVEAFRDYLAPFVLRRTLEEPEVSLEISIPDLTKEYVPVQIDQEHILGYFDQVGYFSKWFDEQMEKHGKIKSRAQLKNRLAAIHWAISFPQSKKCAYQYTQPLTKIQLRVLDDIDDILRNDSTDKIILVYENPEQVEFMAKQLDQRSIPNSFIHGKVSPDERDVRIYDDFCEGPAQVLVASTQTIFESHNIPQASWTLLGDQAWEPYILDQVCGRMRRPGQMKQPIARFYYAPATIQEYKLDTCSSKHEAISEAMDYVESPKQVEIDGLYVLLRRLRDSYEKLSKAA